MDVIRRIAALIAALATFLGGQQVLTPQQELRLQQAETAIYALAPTDTPIPTIIPSSTPTATLNPIFPTATAYRQSHTPDMTLAVPTNLATFNPPSSTPTIDPTPTQDAVNLKWARIVADPCLRVRSAPSLQGIVLDCIPNESELWVEVGQVEGWVKIACCFRVHGWISAAFVEILN